MIICITKQCFANNQTVFDINDMTLRLEEFRQILCYAYIITLYYSF